MFILGAKKAIWIKDSKETKYNKWHSQMNHF